MIDNGGRLGAMVPFSSRYTEHEFVERTVEHGSSGDREPPRVAVHA
jgi:hypothetical protein